MAAGIKTGGRKFGKPNKLTVDLRPKFHPFISRVRQLRETDSTLIWRNFKGSGQIQYHKQVFR